MKQKEKRIIKITTSVLILTFILQFVFFEQQTPVVAQTVTCAGNFQSVAIPLTELGNSEYVRMDGSSTGFRGGLYPNGENLRPVEHEQAGLAAAESIMPLDSDGNYDPENGRIIFLSIGMSNTSMEFDSFIQLAKEDAETNPQIIFINGALSSQTSDRWVDPNAITWQNIADILSRYQLSPAQVQVVWIKLTQTKGGEFPAKAQALESDLIKVVNNLKAVYPNTKIAFLSSRIYSYTYFRGLSPEPNAFETGFSVKWLIEKQINGDPALNFDPEKGEVLAPFLSWGPYIWANGLTARADGLVWLPEDFESDCTHPTASGRLKVASQLMDFFKNDSITIPWFRLPPDDGNNLFLPLITNTATPGVEETPIPELPGTKTPLAEIAITLTPILTLPVQPARQPVNIFAWIIDWFRKIFSKK